MFFSWIPLVMLPPGSARHRPDRGFVSMTPPPSAIRRHCCAPVPLQVYRFTSVPLAVPPWRTFRHLLWMPTVPLVFVVQIWELHVFLHAYMSISLPLVVRFPLSCTHMPGIPHSLSPPRSVPSSFVFPSQNQTPWLVPLVVLEPGSSRPMPDPGLYRVSFSAFAVGFTERGYTSCHCWSAEPVHVPSVTLVFATAGDVRHWP